MVRREHGRGTAGKTLFHLIDGDKCVYLKMILGNSLVIQELREHFAFTAGVHIQFLARALRSCKPHSMAEKKKKDSSSYRYLMHFPHRHGLLHLFFKVNLLGHKAALFAIF